ncbi:hypothetical protein SAMN05892883_1884 [Jatrophihabitans sp. GAS493]|uniref:hypothetical protein n=1 Tax=Jatrophihabitans sp. GAS493 TaxID=1907575 RepID=UPI000BC04268|nr:hypothetical protein [Jatrophihabitans sp. GAS493]SOD72493.1 hypothetical protein SAMN05892883_1884 [Jatrophihabitans sp. GAS493]
MGVYRIRWSYAIGTSLTAPVIVGLVIVLVLRPFVLGFTVAVILGAVNAGITVRRMRRRWMSVDEVGIQVQRDKYGLKVPWDAIQSVRRRRLQGFLQVDEFVLSHSEIVPRDSHGHDVAPPKNLGENPESTERIQVSVYDKNWRHGVIGETLRSRGVPLGAAAAAPHHESH